MMFGGKMAKPDTIVVFDFGGQYCHLIARRVRDNNVHSEIVPCDITKKEFKKLGTKFNLKGIIFSGGPASIYEKNSPRTDASILKSGIPILGICYGHQLIANYVGGDVRKAQRMEFGSSVASISGSERIFQGLHAKERVWMSHGDTVFSIPEEFKTIAHTDNCPIAAFRHSKKQIYGVQWHPEAVHTTNGKRLLRNFIFKICKAERNWTVKNLVEEYTDGIRKTVGNGKAIVALSGGVDSFTASTLTARAVGKKLVAVFVDHGFMRKGEPEQIKESASRAGINLVHVNAKRRFLRRLEGVTDPEEKRKRIGMEFIRVFEEVAIKNNCRYLVQGTIYPDRIESGRSKGSKLIKSHHNVGGMPSKIRFDGLVEPLKELYKDEVKAMARQIGLPKEITNRQPFPGPGLAVRIIGEVTDSRLSILREADAIVTSEIESASGGDLRNTPWQYFAVLTDTNSTGIKGDTRAYGNVIAIRAVKTKDAMSASFSRLPYNVLERISTRITNEIPEVVRVTYDITNKPPATIEWE
jgi:GMP synthase (glutamine-hydrolysing)